LGFVLGFSLIFVLLGASASTLGKLLGSNTTILRYVGGTIIILFGIHISGLIKIPLLYREYRVVEMNKIPSFSSILLGMAFAAGWTPCIGPILASILIVAGNQATVWQGVLLLVFYSLGLSLPFLLFALTIENVREQVNKWTKYMPAVSAISGIVLVLMGILVLSDRLKYLGRFFI